MPNEERENGENTSLDKIVPLGDIGTPERDRGQEKRSCSRLGKSAENDSVPKDAAESSNIGTGEELEKTQSMEGKVVDKKSEEIVGKESKELPVVEVSLIENEASASPNDSSSSNFPSNSAEQSMRHIKVENENKEVQLVENEGDKSKTLYDSEDSICEIPVPPKPRPPIIDLEYSGSSTASDLDLGTEKLFWSDRGTDVKSRKRKTRTRRKSDGKNKRRSLFSDSDDTSDRSKEVNWEAAGRRGEEVNWEAVERQDKEVNWEEAVGRRGEEVNWEAVEKRGEEVNWEAVGKRGEEVNWEAVGKRGEEVNWEALGRRGEEVNWEALWGQGEEVSWDAWSQTNTDKPTASSSRDAGTSEITDKLGTDVEPRDSICEIMGDSDLAHEGSGNQIRESKRKSAMDYSNVTKKRSGGLSETSLVNEPHLDEKERLSQVRQTLAESNEKGKGRGSDHVVDDDALLISAELDKDLLDLVGSRAPETSTRTSDVRKRPVTDSGKKSKHRNSPKKLKSSNDSAVAGSSSRKSPGKNKENKYKDRNRAADYFWENIAFDIYPNQSKTPRAPWAILYENLHGCQEPTPTSPAESKCENSNGTGHCVAECPEKRKDPSCYMCGAEAHRELRCSDKTCLGCRESQETHKQVCVGCYSKWCHRCQEYGHTENHCPNPFSRYHSTTSHKDVDTQPNVEEVMKLDPPPRCGKFSKDGHSSASIECPSEVGDLIEAEKTQTDGGVTHKSLLSNEEREMQSNSDKVLKENTKANEFIRDKSKAADKTVEKAVKQSKKEREPKDEDVQKSVEPRQKDCKALKSGESTLEFKSELLDTKLTQAADFGEHKFSVIAKTLEQQWQHERLSDSLSHEFFLNLTSQFPMKLEIFRYETRKMIISIESARDLHEPLQLTITDWLTRQKDERDRFRKLNLPREKKDLVKLLTEKLDQLKQDLGNPVELYVKIKSLRREVEIINYQSQSKASENMKHEWKKKIEELNNADCKLNMMLLGQVTSKSSRRSLIFLQNTLRDMRRATSPHSVSAATYLQLVHHYNIIFAAYVPASRDSVLFAYWQKLRPLGKLGEGLNRTYASFKNDIDKLSRSINSDTSTMDGSGKIKPQNVSGANSDRVKSKVVIPGKNLDDINHNLRPNSLPPQIQSPDGSDRLENDCDNSKSGLEDNSESQRRPEGTVQSGGQQYTCITLDSPDKENDHRNKKKDFITVDSDEELEGVCTDISTTRNCMNKTVKTESENSFGINLVQSNPILGTNICQVGIAPPTTAFPHVFLPGSQAFQNVLHKNTSNVQSRDEIETRNRKDVIGPSIFGLHDLTITRSDYNPGTDAKQYRADSDKKQIKKKKRDSTLPLYLQKRAEENIAKYVDLGVPCIIRAATEMREKIKNEDLTLQCVAQFEKLIEVKLKKIEHLL